jgi:hypothetical protein
MRGELAQLQARIDALAAGDDTSSAADATGATNAITEATDHANPALAPVMVAKNVAAAAEATAGAVASEAGAGMIAEAEATVPPEVQVRLASLRGQKKYLEEIKELEAQIRALQEGEAGASGGDVEIEAPVAGMGIA